MAGTFADVVVIGGGIAGVSVAALLAADRSVLLLETESHLAYHTTGRSAAIFLESYGGRQVRALTRASRPLYDAVPELDSDATPLLTPSSELIISDHDRLAELDALTAEVPSLHRITVDEALTHCPVLSRDYLAGAAFDAGTRGIDVLGLHQHYVRTGRKRGLSIRTNTQVLSGTRTDGTWHLETTDGPVSAPVVIDAAGAWADVVAQGLGAEPVGLTPLRRTAAVVPVADVDPGWPMVMDVAEDFYFRPEGTGLLISPADETPDEPRDARPDELDVALAIENINAASTLGIRSVSTTWAGLRTFAPDRAPVVGWDTRLPGLFWFAGQGGYGIQMAPALAVLAAAQVRGVDTPHELLAEGVDSAELSPDRFTTGG